LAEPNKRAKHYQRNGVGRGHAPLVQRHGVATRVQKENGLRRASELHHHGADAKTGRVRFPKEEPHRECNAHYVVGDVFFRHG